MTWITAHWDLITAIATPVTMTLIATLVSVFGDPDHDPATPPPKWVQALQWLQRLATAYAPAGHTDIAGTRLSIPFVTIPKKTTGLPLPNDGARVWLPFLFAGVLVINGCAYCKNAQHASEARCKTEAIVTDCAAPEVIKLVLHILPQVFSALVTNDLDHLLGNVENQLSNEGVSDAPGILTCAVNEAMRFSLVFPRVALGDAWKKRHPRAVRERR